jgi:hypothetical protein
MTPAIHHGTLVACPVSKSPSDAGTHNSLAIVVPLKRRRPIGPARSIVIPEDPENGKSTPEILTSQDVGTQLRTA